MKYCLIKLQSQSATFRDPEFQNFHKTLELPPPTTVIGLTGAALGYSPQGAQVFFDENHISLGVYGTSKGKAVDVWKYNKLTKNMWSYVPGRDSGVLQKEILHDNEFLIAFSCQDEKVITRLCNAFENPVFALTVGNSDSLAKITVIRDNLIAADESKVGHCIMEGDILGEVFEHAKNSFNFSVYQTSQPVSYKFPIRFLYKTEYGQRSISAVKTFSILTHPMELNYSVSGVKHHDTFIPLFSINP